MQFRYEQIEVRDNTREYKHLYGVDLALELQKAVQFVGLSSAANQREQTTNYEGCVMISPLKNDSYDDDSKESNTYLHLANKFDYLSNGKAKTGYHTLKDRQLTQKGNIISVTYTEALEAFKTTDNAEDFLKRAIPQLF